MDVREKEYVTELIARYPILEPLQDQIKDGFFMIRESYSMGGKLMAAGNGGSASDAEHIVGELMKSFILKRPISADLRDKLMRLPVDMAKELVLHLEMPLTAISLTTHEALTSAYSNDVDDRYGFAQQLLGFGRKEDVFLAISTSGNSENIIYCALLARAMGIKILALTGGTGGMLRSIADVSIVVPEQETYKIQELHLPIYHCLCRMLEYSFFGQK